MTDALWDSRLSALGLTVRPADYTKPHWRLQAAWLTVNGRWDDVPDFARPYQQDTLGGAQHAYGRAVFKDGSVAPEAGFMLMWPDMAEVDKKVRTPSANGWANDELWNGFDWAQTSGPYSWHKAGNADVLEGLGLPFPPLPWYADAQAEGGVHAAFFCVWQEREAEDPTPPPPPPYDGYVSVKPIYDVVDCQEAIAEVDSLDPGADIDTPDGDRAHVLKVLIFDFERFLWLDQPRGWKCRLAEWLCPRAFE